MALLQINGVTDEDRQSIVARLGEAISAGGGWIVDHRAYSDLSLCLVFEVGGPELPVLWQRLSALPIRFDDKTHAAMADPRTDEDVSGTLEVRFTQGTGDLPRTVPAVPG